MNHQHHLFSNERSEGTVGKGRDISNGLSNQEFPTALASEAAVNLSSSRTSMAPLQSDSATRPVGEVPSGQKQNFLQTLTLTDTKPLVIGSLDPRMNLQDFAKAGVAADMSFPIPLDSKSRMDNLMAAADAGNVQVLNQNADRMFISSNSIANVAPDLIIKRDGTVELHNVPTQGPCVIQFEGSHKPGTPAPPLTAEQIRAADEFSRWSDAHKSFQEQAHLRTMAEAALREQNALQAARQAAEVNNRFDQSGNMSSKDASDYFPKREQTNESRRNEPVDEASVMDMLAKMSGADKQHPYEAVRSTENGYAVGRYGITENVFWDWFSSLEEFADLGKPPDMKKMAALMAKLAKHKKIPAAFAEKFKQPGMTEEFGDFLVKMNSGEGNIKGDIAKFMPKELQETIMRGVVEKAARDGTDASTLALAMHLGKPVARLTKEDLDDKRNQSYMEASMKVLGLALAKHQAGPNDQISWNGSKGHGGAGDHGSRNRHNDDENANTPLAFRIANAAERNASNVGTVGWCYREVANTLDRFGVHLYGMSAYMAAPQLAKNEHFKEVSAQGELKKGTVLVFAPTANHPNGHITVYLGNGREASDHVQGLVNFNAYGGVRAFQPTA